MYSAKNIFVKDKLPGEQIKTSEPRNAARSVWSMPTSASSTPHRRKRRAAVRTPLANPPFSSRPNGTVRSASEFARSLCRPITTGICAFETFELTSRLDVPMSHRSRWSRFRFRPRPTGDHGASAGALGPRRPWRAVLHPIWRTKPEVARKLYPAIRRVFERGRVILRDEHNIAMPDNPARWDDLKAMGFEAPAQLSRGRHPLFGAAQRRQSVEGLTIYQEPDGAPLVILTRLRHFALRPGRCDGLVSFQAD